MSGHWCGGCLILDVRVSPHACTKSKPSQFYASHKIWRSTTSSQQHPQQFVNVTMLVSYFLLAFYFLLSSSPSHNKEKGFFFCLVSKEKGYGWGQLRRGTNGTFLLPFKIKIIQNKWTFLTLYIVRGTVELNCCRRLNT